MRRLLSRLLPFLLLSLPLTSAQADDQLDCPESALTTYLVSLIDTLYNHGLTSFEQLIASLSETDSGYSLLDSWLSAGTFTLLAPTDAAFQAANLYPPFTGMSETDMANLAALHTLAGTWTYDKLPESPMHGIASTSLKIQGYMNSSTGSGAEQAMVLQQGEGGAVSVRMAGGNGTTWSGPIDLGGKGLNNIMVLPVDAVVGFPPNLSTALTLPTTSRSANGLSNMAAALGSNGGAAKLEALTPNGFTTFVPVDDAWTAQVKALMNDSSGVATLLSNHYTTNFSMYSSFFTGPGSYSLTLDSGQNASLTYNSSGSFVAVGEVNSQILRSDVPLENGVMHIIDKVLLSPSTNSSTSSSSSTSAGPSTAPIIASLTTDLSKGPATSASPTANSASPPANGTAVSGKSGQSTSGAEKLSKMDVVWFALGAVVGFSAW